ncbi:hypothetical protein ACJ73_08872 [Blastomyces percursus]|uniref:Bacteriophage T5 Orf172 DNA-binding domain-containing protein n=1 Tax=Blastomyces percursus TaxID=1658174 RepID=A0A1J9QL35_9EURO|nr:hypothetical protein ACJ73_08872 [Blastomyces percursus]
MATEHIVILVEPQTPTKAKFSPTLHGDKPDTEETFSSRESTPPSTPEGKETSIFSQQNSIDTDATSECGWGSSTPERLSTRRYDLLSSPTPSTLLGDSGRKSMRPAQEPLTTGHVRPPGLILRRTKSTGSLHPQLKILSSAFEGQGGRFSPRSLNSLLQDTVPTLEEPDDRRPKGLILRKDHATVSEQELRLVEIFSQLRESRVNSEAYNLKRPRLSEQEISTPERQESIKRDSSILQSDCINTNFRKKGLDFKNQRSGPGTATSSAGPTLVMPVPVPKTLFDVRAASEVFARIIPRNIDQRLTEASGRWVASVIKGKYRRCFNTKNGNIQGGDALLETVPACDILQWVETLIGSSLCTTHKKTATKELNKQDPWFGKSQHAQSTKSGDQLVAGSSAVNASSISVTRASCPKPQQPKAGQFPSYTTSHLPTECQECISTSRWLEKKIKSSFKNNDNNTMEGFIYIYWQPGNFGQLKIEVYFPKQDAADEQEKQDLIPVKHILRVEGLVHAELREQRKREGNCAGCGKTHHEWFEVSPVIAVEVARKWMRWMREEQRYKQVPARGGWHYIGMTGAVLADLCEPHEKLASSKLKKAATTTKVPS